MPEIAAIDLRSDTVTRPTPGMRDAMAHAEVGDQVLGDDPTVLRLEERAAALLGKEEALYVPSGTMANLCAIRSQTEPGDEIVAHAESHFYFYETGGFAGVAGCSTRLVNGTGGVFEADEIDRLVRPAGIHAPRTRLVLIENTHNRGGGTVWPPDRLEAVAGRARAFDLRIHLDGARLMNACVAAGVEPSAYTAHVDTVSLCFSKGLGAPVGSVVAADCATIERIRRIRKMLGGVMRQSGIVAAGAIFALDHHVERLAEDHGKARRFAERIAKVDGLDVAVDRVETNMVFFEVDERFGGAAEFCRALEGAGVRMLPVAPRRVRAVFHLDVTAEETELAAERVASLALALRRRSTPRASRAG